MAAADEHLTSNISGVSPYAGDASPFSADPGEALPRVPDGVPSLAPSGNGRTLAQRGIDLPAQMMRWQAGEGRYARGWVYPVYDYTDAVIAWRWKAYDSNAEHKYIWVEGKADYYHIGETLPDAIAAADGLLYIANGEPATLTQIAAGLFNTLSFFGEKTIPETLIADLLALGVRSVRYYPDKDPHGQQAAVKLRDVLQGSGIAFDCRSLPDELPAKADTNDLWQLLAFDVRAFRGALANAPAYDLPAPEPEPPPVIRQRKADIQPAGETIDWEAERALWWQQIVLPTLDTAAPVVKGRGRKHEYRHCPNPTHADKKPSFRISFDKITDGLPICTCGVQDEHDPRGTLASWLGAPDFMTWWKAERAPLFAKARKAKRASGKAAKESTDAPALRPFTLQTPTGDITVNLRYISDIAAGLLPTEGALIVRSPINTGKTRLAARMIAHLSALLGRPVRVLVITHRQALAENLTDRLNREGHHFECYKGLAGADLRRIDRLVICANSLPKLIAGIGAALPTYDAVFIDESEQVLNHLGSRTLRKGEPIIVNETARALVTAARLVVLMDADAGDRSREWLTEAGKQSLMLVNTCVFERGPLALYDNKEALINSANRLIDEQAGTVVIPCGSIREAKRLKRYYIKRYGEDAVYLICGENSEGYEAQEFIRQINDRLPSVRVFIYTASLGTGVDITCPVRAVCGVFGSKPLTATEMQQMIGRCRNTRETHVFIKHAEGNAETDAEALYKRYTSNALRTKKAIQIVAGVVSLSPEQQRLTRLLCACKADRNRSANNLRGHFAALTEGYQVTLIKGGGDEALRLELSEIGQAVNAEEKAAVLIADPVSYEEYEQKRQRGKLTDADRAGKERYRIEDVSGQTITPPLYDELHPMGGTDALVRFTDVTDTDAHMKEADRVEDGDNVLLTRLKHRTLQRRLARHLFKDVYGDVISAEVELTGEQIGARMADFLEAHTDDLRDLYDWRSDQSQNPVAILRWVLEKRYGLKLISRQLRKTEARERGIEDQDRPYVYHLDPERLAQMDYNARCRRARLEQQRAEREARWGDLNRVLKDQCAKSNLSVLPTQPAIDSNQGLNTMLDALGATPSRRSTHDLEFMG